MICQMKNLQVIHTVKIDRCTQAHRYAQVGTERRRHRHRHMQMHRHTDTCLLYMHRYTLYTHRYIETQGCIHSLRDPVFCSSKASAVDYFINFKLLPKGQIQKIGWHDNRSCCGSGLVLTWFLGQMQGWISSLTTVTCCCVFLKRKSSQNKNLLRYGMHQNMKPLKKIDLIKKKINTNKIQMVAATQHRSYFINQRTLGWTDCHMFLYDSKSWWK